MPHLFCSHCGKDVAEEDRFCSACGRRLDRRRIPGWVPPPSPGRLWYAGLGAMFLAFLLSLVGLGALGAYQGLQVRAAEDKALAEEYYRRGTLHLQEGNILLALAELEAAAQLDPADIRIREALLGARTEAVGMATPTSETLEQAARGLFEAAASLWAQQEWAAAIEKLEQLRRLAPEHRQAEVEELLFEASVRLAQQKVAARQIREALPDWERATLLRPSHDLVAEELEKARLYIQALDRWASDWRAVIDTLGALYRLDPDYADGAELLEQAHLALAKSYEEQAAWCLALAEYEEALALTPNSEVSSLRDRAEEACRAAVSATPTPAEDEAQP